MDIRSLFDAIETVHRMATYELKLQTSGMGRQGPTRDSTQKNFDECAELLFCSCLFSRELLLPNDI